MPQKSSRRVEARVVKRLLPLAEGHSAGVLLPLSGPGVRWECRPAAAEVGGGPGAQVLGTHSLCCSLLQRAKEILSSQMSYPHKTFKSSFAL